MAIKAYVTKVNKLGGSNYGEIHKKAFALFTQIKKRSKRRPYIRSAYFRKDKGFLNLFWSHLGDKFSHKEKMRRLKYYPCALELIRHSRFDPTSKENVDRKSEILYRFTGVTSDNDLFFVQVKENKRNGQKYLMSVFPMGK